MDRPASIQEAFERAAAKQGPPPLAEGTPSSVARLDEYVQLSQTNPAAFAALPEDLRRRVADRALNLANRARAEQESGQ
ncbi:hypothetical protein [Nonomuraea rhizosphaerae]|uniref:hypothetical protein n=1 Tax=Nonomuraea rhizosphaerae TaxID=2665663 RepID=UPI001C60679E|nr:hypothetical protein [Nonomuraea rhizosphaerae]